MESHLVAIGRFRNARAATASQRALEEAGIASWLAADAGLLVPPKRRSVRLQVREDDVDAADHVLNELYGVAHAERVGPSDEAPYPDLCPACGSPDVHVQRRSIVFVTLAVLVIAFGLVAESDSIYFVFAIATAAIAVALLDVRQCRSCGERWK